MIGDKQTKNCYGLAQLFRIYELAKTIKQVLFKIMVLIKSISLQPPFYFVLYL